MKRIGLAIMLLASSFISRGQEESFDFDQFDEKDFDKKELVIDGFYGAGTLTSAFLNALVNESDNSSMKSIGPTGLKLTYMVEDDFGFGIEASYVNHSLEWTTVETEEFFDNRGNVYYEDVEYNSEIKREVIRIMGRIEGIFYDESNLQLFGSFSFGYRHVKWSVRSDYENLDTDFPGLFPMSTRFATGMRYFPVSRVGINLELGLLGGAIFHGGLTVKI